MSVKCQRCCGRYVIVCVCVCEQDYCRHNELIPLKPDVMIGSTNRKNWSTFGGDPILDIRITFPLPSPLSISRYLLAFLTHSHRPLFTTLNEITEWIRYILGAIKSTATTAAGLRPATMVIAQHRVCADKSIAVPTWTGPQAGGGWVHFREKLT